MNNLNDSKFKEKLLKIFPQRYIKETDYTNSKIKPGDIGALSFYLWGPVGCGKTQLVVDELAEQILDEKIDDEYDPYFYTEKIKFYNATELMALLRSLFDKNNSNKNFSNIEDFLEYITRKGLYAFDYIILDDLGAEKQSEWVQETFYLLINKLYENESPSLIITSNKSLQEIAESLGDRVASRIAEMCEVIKLEGKDRRIK